MVPIEECNVLFITLDSCRFDSFEIAKPNYLMSLGLLMKAKTMASYTFPAHMSFFVGYLPIVMNRNAPIYYNSELKQLWRLNTARYRSPDSVGILLNGENVFDGYRKMGYKIIGGGGVGWFNSKMLQSLFDEFHFVGPFNHDNIWRERKSDEFILNNYDKLLNSLRTSHKWFLFLNCAETHAPYDTGNSYTHEIKKLIEYSKSCWGGKINKAVELRISKELLKPLHNLQIDSVKIIDSRIKKFMEMLPNSKPILIVICGDHGEAFGEKYLFGHGMSVVPVLDVPLIINIINK